jgi:hypothetical protein
LDNGFNGVQGYQSVAGWDACTGWGSINGGQLFFDLFYEIAQRNPGCLAAIKKLLGM